MALCPYHWRVNASIRFIVILVFSHWRIIWLTETARHDRTRENTCTKNASRCSSHRNAFFSVFKIGKVQHRWCSECMDCSTLNAYFIWLYIDDSCHETFSTRRRNNDNVLSAREHEWETDLEPTQNIFKSSDFFCVSFAHRTSSPVRHCCRHQPFKTCRSHYYGISRIGKCLAK